MPTPTPARRTLTRALTALAALGAAVAGSTLFQTPARGGPPPADDGVPAGAMAYFAGDTCPTGWAPDTDVEGRLVVGVVDPLAVGVTVGTPLGDRENRTHTHAYSGTVDLPAQAISAANGGNQQGAGAGTYTVAGDTSPAPSGAPLVQMRACVKQ